MNKKGFSLFEVLIAISILSIAVIPILALIPLGLKSSQFSSEEAQATHLLTAIVQDFRFSPSTNSQSELFKLSNTPYNGARIDVVNRVWIDSCWNVYREKNKSKIQTFEVEWRYLEVPDSESFSPVEAEFKVKWPPKLKSESRSEAEQENKGGEISCGVAFQKLQK